MPIHISVSAHIKIIVPGPVNTPPMFAAAVSHTFAAFGGLYAADRFALIGLMPGLYPIVTTADFRFAPVAVRTCILFGLESRIFIFTRVMRLTILAVMICISGSVFSLMISGIAVIIRRIVIVGAPIIVITIPPVTVRIRVPIIVWIAVVVINI